MGSGWIDGRLSGEQLVPVERQKVRLMIAVV